MVSRPTKKRAASPNPPELRKRTKPRSIIIPKTQQPPSTRKLRSTVQKPAPVPNGAVSTKPSIKALPTVAEAIAPPQTPYFNPLPTVPEHVRPTPLMFAWGAGNFGQLCMGPGDTRERDRPTRNKWVDGQIAEGTFGAGVESVSSGGLHTLFIDEKGTIWSCGVNDNAALGRVTKTIVSEATGKLTEDEALAVTPHPIQSLVDEKFRAVKAVAGDSIGAAISDKGDLRVWGCFRGVDGVIGYSAETQNQFRPVPVLQKAGEKLSNVASGDNHLLALTTHGVVYSWGDSELGQLGRKLALRRRISGTIPQTVFLGKRGKSRAVAIGAGGMTSFAVDEEGVLWGWGLNNFGQTGTGSQATSVWVPTKVDGMSKEELGGTSVVAMEGGEHHSLFLTSDGKVYACGRANAGQIGLPKDDPVFVDGEERRDHLRVAVEVKFPDEDDPVIEISCGSHNNAAITKGGALYCWGQGTQGELGLRNEEEVWEPTVVRKDGDNWKALSVSCGGQHTIGLFTLRKICPLATGTCPNHLLHTT